MILINSTDLGRPYDTISLVSGIGDDPRSGINAKNAAISCMIQEAAGMGAGAIINIRFSYSVNAAYNILVSGTAVKFK